MRSVLGRRLAAIAGGSAITPMVVLTAWCAKEEEKAPETSTTTTTTTTTGPEPTEKAPRLEPGGPNPVLAVGDRAARALGHAPPHWLAPLGSART